jgi:hypothetical protein
LKKLDHATVALVPINGEYELDGGQLETAFRSRFGLTLSTDCGRSPEP